MKQVTVIGGGVIGLTSAWWLLQAGFRVTLIEREDQVGQGASYRNGGQLSYRYVSPLADAGVPFKALGWMFDRDGPLRFKPEADLRQWRWLLQFLACCRGSVNRRTTATLLQLGELSRLSMMQLDELVPTSSFAWRDAGKLVVHRSQASLAAAQGRNGEAGQQMSARECVALEPALAAMEGDLAGGIFNTGEAVADCHAFCLALAARLRSHPNFGGIVHTRAHVLANAGGKISGIITSAGLMGADAFVLAAGIQSRTLAASADIALPLYPIKGYSLSAPIRATDLAPAISVTDFERKVLYARIGDQLRVAAMADIVGEDTRIDPQRIAGLIAQVRAAMPQAADYQHMESWAGLRPATPNGAPLIGPTRYSNLWLNVGHGALGFTFACGSARILADLMQGKAPPMALAGLTPRT
ncbi:MAG: D-amino acid dehydrogenase [Massilia sp.]